MNHDTGYLVSLGKRQARTSGPEEAASTRAPGDEVPGPGSHEPPFDTGSNRARQRARDWPTGCGNAADI